jgi:hypothetical protein
MNPRLTQLEDRAARSHREATAIIETERIQREAKTARLRALRLAKARKEATPTKKETGSPKKRRRSSTEPTDLPAVRPTGAGDANDDHRHPKARRRSRVAKGEDFEVQHLAETTDLSPNQARELLRRHGNDWRKLKEVAKTFKAES